MDRTAVSPCLQGPRCERTGPLEALGIEHLRCFRPKETPAWRGRARRFVAHSLGINTCLVQRLYKSRFARLIAFVTRSSPCSWSSLCPAWHNQPAAALRRRATALVSFQVAPSEAALSHAQANSASPDGPASSFVSGPQRSAGQIFPAAAAACRCGDRSIECSETAASCSSIKDPSLPAMPGPPH